MKINYLNKLLLHSPEVKVNCRKVCLKSTTHFNCTQKLIESHIICRRKLLLDQFILSLVQIHRTDAFKTEARARCEFQ